MKTQFFKKADRTLNLKPFQMWVILMLVFYTFLGCSHESAKTTDTKVVVATGQNQPKPVVEKYTFRIIPALENTFGYEILDQGKILVEQKSIPSLPGNRGFHTEDDAEKCAVFVISKLNRNIMPPSVTPKELDSLGIFINSKTF